MSFWLHFYIVPRANSTGRVRDIGIRSRAHAVSLVKECSRNVYIDKLKTRKTSSFLSISRDGVLGRLAKGQQHSKHYSTIHIPNHGISPYESSSFHRLYNSAYQVRWINQSSSVPSPLTNSIRAMFAISRLIQAVCASTGATDPYCQPRLSPL